MVGGGGGYTTERGTRLGKPASNTSQGTHNEAVTPGEASGKQEGNVSQQVNTGCSMCCCGTAVQDNVTSRLCGLKGGETDTVAPFLSSRVL